MNHDPNFNLKEVRPFLHSHMDPAANQKQPPADKHSQDEMDQPIVGYRMLDKMGSGGMAVVFKAEHIATGKIVALKLLYPHHDKKALKQFLHEGMVLMGLDHPNVLKGFDFGISKNFYFLAIEFVEGESLVSFLEKGFKFTEAHTFRIALQIAQAIGYLASKGIVHRDIKPANILMVAEIAKLCDFALALDTRSLDKSADDEAEFTCGTVEYISPEQARGQTSLDSRSDIYSLGLTCLHMITGKVPFSGDSPQEIMRCQIYEAIDWRQLKLTSTTKAILKRMVAKQPDGRLYPATLIRVLQKYLQRHPA